MYIYRYINTFVLTDSLTHPVGKKSTGRRKNLTFLHVGRSFDAKTRKNTATSKFELKTPKNQQKKKTCNKFYFYFFICAPLREKNLITIFVQNPGVPEKHVRKEITFQKFDKNTSGFDKYLKFCLKVDRLMLKSGKIL